MTATDIPPVDRDREARHSRARRLARAIRAPVRLALLRDPARRDWAARAGHPGQRFQPHLGLRTGAGLTGVLQMRSALEG